MTSTMFALPQYNGFFRTSDVSSALMVVCTASCSSQPSGESMADSSKQPAKRPCLMPSHRSLRSPSASAKGSSYERFKAQARQRHKQRDCNASVLAFRSKKSELAVHLDQCLRASDYFQTYCKYAKYLDVECFMYDEFIDLLKALYEAYDRPHADPRNPEEEKVSAQEDDRYFSDIRCARSSREHPINQPQFNARVASGWSDTVAGDRMVAAIDSLSRCVTNSVATDFNTVYMLLLKFEDFCVLHSQS